MRGVERMESVQAALADPSAAAVLPIETPFGQSGTLERVLFQDIFGTEVAVSTRAQAMRVPAVARGRNLIVASGAGIPLRELDGDTPTPDQPAWISQTGTTASPQHRMAWTLDDLMFHGLSCWWRSPTFPDGPAGRINWDDWTIDPDMQIRVQGQTMRPDQVIVFTGLHEGILAYGRDALEDYRLLQKIVRQRLKNPKPQLELHQTEGADLTPEEIEALLDHWAEARAGDRGGVGFTSRHIEINELGEMDAQLMIEARNAAALDLARTIGVTAALLDATAPKASLNYETTTGRNREFIDRDLNLYLLPIAARLSLDDISEPGRRVAWDFSDFTMPIPTTTTGPTLED